MSFDGQAFRERYVAAGGTPDSARSYVSYLNRVDRLCGGIDERISAEGAEALIAWAERQAHSGFGGGRERRDSLSALRRFVALLPKPVVPGATASLPAVTATAEVLADLLAEARDLGARYYALTGKPLGVTGEVAELAASEALGLELAIARTPGFDGWLRRDQQRLKVQVKGRAVSAGDRYRGRCPAIKCGGQFDIVLLVLLDRTNLLPLEIWEATEAAVAARLAHPGSKARNERGSLGITQFKSIAKLIWSA